MCLDFPTWETNLESLSAGGAQGLGSGLLHFLVPQGLSHQFEGCWPVWTHETVAPLTGFAGEIPTSPARQCCLSPAVIITIS